MKKLLCIGALVCLWVVKPGLAQLQTDQKIPLDQGWRFITGDNPAWSSPGFDDSTWKSIAVDKIWEDQGYDPYDGFAWFRVNVKIPSSLKTSAFLKDSLCIYLGKINNYDETYLNGSLIGTNARNVPPGGSPDTGFTRAPIRMYDVKRTYTLSAGDSRIRWDQENTIAVRVYDQGGQGGMYTGHQFVGMTELRDYLRNNNPTQPFQFGPGRVTKEVTLSNVSSGYVLPGKFRIHTLNPATGEEHQVEEATLQLEPGGKRTFHLDLPRLDESITLVYTFTFTDNGQVVSDSEVIPYLLTPEPPESPRINGARITAVRPGSPFLYAIAATGLRPMKFKAQGLPEGLSLDPVSGIITGRVMPGGDYPVNITVINSKGTCTRELLIRVGDQLALTPPMGWNSWNCWGLAVDQEKVLASAHAFVNSGLIEHGWTYINIDDGWEISGDSKDPKRDQKGNILTNSKFPDMKVLADSIHRLGLKIGIYSSPGPLTCGGYTASYQHELQDAESFSGWGIDYLKYDWCSYENIGNKDVLEDCKRPYILMGECLKKQPRDIVYSLCQYGNQDVWKWGAGVGGNLWRTTGDITETWESMSGIGFGQVDNASFAGPGHWNDPDMLVVGWVGWGPDLHPTGLTADEQYTHISLWCLLSAPLLIGCDLTRMDPFTMNLLTNDEVLALDQDPLGKQALPRIISGNIQVWVKELADGTKAAGIFNLGDLAQSFAFTPAAVGMAAGSPLRDLWRQKKIPLIRDTCLFVIPAHGVRLVKQEPAPSRK